MATDNKYDRQLRLWGAHGQRALNTSHICLLGSNGLGTEILKNLILPGIGEVTIVDDAVVTERDMGNNFFLTVGEIGQPRAEVTVRHLCELNPDATGHAHVANISELIRTSPDYFDQFNLIIGSQLNETDTLAIAKIAEGKDKWLMICRTIGFLSYIRLYSREHRIIESKEADKEYDDLRLNNLLPAVVEFCDEIDMAGLESMDHHHVPYVVILYKQLQAWREAHSGANPESFADKQAFREQIKTASRDFVNELNF
jgi:amyloid beta precursor protein binding protein 1